MTAIVITFWHGHLVSLTMTVSAMCILNTEFLNIEFALKKGVWELPRHEKIPAIHVLSTQLTEMPGFLMEKDILHIGYQQVISEYVDVCRCASHGFRSQFILHMCDAQVFKTQSSEINY